MDFDNFQVSYVYLEDEEEEDNTDDSEQITTGLFMRFTGGDSIQAGSLQIPSPLQINPTMVTMLNSEPK